MKKPTNRQLRFQRVFSTKDGEMVLAEILKEAKFFVAGIYIDQNDNPKLRPVEYERGLHDLAMWIWKEAMGTFQISKLAVLYERLAEVKQQNQKIKSGENENG